MVKSASVRMRQSYHPSLLLVSLLLVVLVGDDARADEPAQVSMQCERASEPDASSPPAR